MDDTQTQGTEQKAPSFGEELQTAHERIASLESELASAKDELAAKVAELEGKVKGELQEVESNVSHSLKTELAEKTALIDEVIPHVQAVTDQAPAAHIGLRAWLVKIFDHKASLEVAKTASTEPAEQATT